MLAALLAWGCGKRQTPVEVADEQGVLLVGNAADPAELDPHLITGITESRIIAALFEGLVVSDPRTLEPRPGVAERWEVSPDGLVYTFYLRPDARWSNGDPVTAGDFAFSFRRILTAGLGAEYAKMLYPIRGAEAFHKGREKEFSKVGVVAKDARTLEVTLEHPTPYFLSLLDHSTYQPVHPPTIERFGAHVRGTRWTRPGNLVSNGPFRLTRWSVNDRVVVEKNPTYWDAATVRLNAIHFIPITNQNTEERAFRAGQLHVTDSVPLGKIKPLREEKSPYLRMDPWFGTYYYIFNTRKPPFNDPRVRLAFALSIDREAVCEHVLGGGQQPARSFTPPGTAGFQPIATFADAPERARALLAQAGYPEGRGFPAVSILFNTSEAHRPIAEALQQMWQKNLGVSVNLQNVSWPAYLAARRAGEFQIARASWIGDYNDPTTFLECWTSDNGLNHTGWKSTTFDGLLAKAASTADPAARLALLQQAEARLLEEAPLVPLYFYSRVYLIRPSVRGWYPNLLDLHPPKHVWLDPHWRSSPSPASR